MSTLEEMLKAFRKGVDEFVSSLRANHPGSYDGEPKTEVVYDPVNKTFQFVLTIACKEQQ